ncbi:MAG TPA: hypothetical protein VK021_00835, partial [Flavobacteriaceae bacterium]|nr:hypothetical protein [Flavobacteriaceae bacterium]
SQDDIVASEMHLPVDQKVLIKMRSQDVIHSAYFPLFRAQMNVVPGMVTQYAITPTITTKEMRERDYMRDKVETINDYRRSESEKLAILGEEGLDDYKFDYFVLCNKVCGTSHYNMQMKIIVEEQDEFEEWLAQQETFGESMEKN